MSESIEAWIRDPADCDGEIRLAAVNALIEQGLIDPSAAEQLRHRFS